MSNTGSHAGTANRSGAAGSGSTAASGATSHRGEEPPEPTLGRLVADASRDISTLLHNEIALAKAEVKISATLGGVGAAALAAAALVAGLAVVLLSFAFVYLLVLLGLAEVWSFLIIAIIYFLVAGGVALFGVRKLKQVRAPERTIATSKKIPPALKGQRQTPALQRTSSRD